MASKNVILQLLPVMDNFELALKNTTTTTNTNDKDFLKGVELIYSQFLNILRDNGVKPIKTKNKQFDPYFHEALMKVDSNLPKNTVVEEFQKGFLLHDKVIRHAKVKVSNGKKEDNKQPLCVRLFIDLIPSIYP